VTSVEIGGTNRVAVSGSRVYAVGSALHIIDVSNPASPVALGSVNTPGGYGLATSESYVYAGGLHVVDVSNPVSPIVLGSANTRAVFDAAISGSYVVVAHSNDLTILEPQCSIPTDVQLSYLRVFSQPQGVVLEWATALGTELSGFHVFRSLQSDRDYRRITTQPVLPPSPYHFLDSNLHAGLVYYYRLEGRDRSGGLQVFGPVSVRFEGGIGKQLVLGQAFPNPVLEGSSTIPFTMGTSGNVRIRVLDFAGKEVRHLMDEIVDPGEHSVTWDGTNERGERVPAGIYLYQVRSRSIEATRKLIRLR